jgi:hypothetical protein
VIFTWQIIESEARWKAHKAPLFIRPFPSAMEKFLIAYRKPLTAAYRHTKHDPQ